MNRFLTKFALGTVIFTAVAGLLVGAKAADRSFYDRTNGKEVKYQKNELNCILNGEAVATDSPIIYGESGSAFATASDFFAEALNTTCVFKLSDSSLSFEINDNSVKLKVGEKNIEINGQKSEVQEAPRVLRDENGVSAVYVPSKAVAGSLGMTYKWTEATDTISIEKKNEVKITADITETAFEIPLFAELSAKDVIVDENFVMWKTKNGSSGVEKWLRQSIVKIPGTKSQYREYLNLFYKNTYSTINDLSITYADGYIVFTFDTSIIRAVTTEIKDSVLYLSFKHPTEVYDKILVIDPGHGGVDYGAGRDGHYESVMNLSMAYTYTKDLFAQSNIKVYYTRTESKLVTLYQRRMLAAEVGADLFISLHQNADNTESSSYRGTCVIYSKYNNNPNESGLTSKIMAEMLAKSITDAIGTRFLSGNGATSFKELDVTTLNGAIQDVNLAELKEDSAERILYGDAIDNAEYSTIKIPSKTQSGVKLTYAVLKETPSVLIEVGILSNASDLAILIDDENQKKVGKCIYDVVTEIFEKYPTSRMESFVPATTE